MRNHTPNTYSRYFWTACLSLVLASLFACQSEDENSLAYALQLPEPTAAQLEALSGKKDILITIETPFGTMKAILFDQTPKHKANFLKLAQEDFYDSLLFHRVIKDFMIQGGDPDSREAEPEQPLGNGGPGYTIPAEFVDGLFHQKGAIAAARMGGQVNPEKESHGSQFYIVQGKTFTEEELREIRFDRQSLYAAFIKLLDSAAFEDLNKEYLYLQQEQDQEGLEKLILENQDKVEAAFGTTYRKPLTERQIKAYTTIGGAPHLDYDYTVFGQVLTGFDVLDKLAAVQTGRGNRPKEDVWMLVSVEEMKKKKIAKKFGYIYPEMRE
mgnify:CR=1 FL=1